MEIRNLARRARPQHRVLAAFLIARESRHRSGGRQAHLPGTSLPSPSAASGEQTSAVADGNLEAGTISRHENVRDRGPLIPVVTCPKREVPTAAASCPVHFKTVG